MSSSNEGEGFLNLQLNRQGRLVAQDPLRDQSVPVSARFGCSTHNCRCKGSKTGLVFYPKDLIHKNIVLLVCENCYGYKQGQETQHQQLATWYYGIYGKSKTFSFVSGFAQKADGKLGFNSGSMNVDQTQYHTTDRAMGDFEQKVVQQAVDEQSQSHEKNATSTRYSEEGYRI